MSEQKPSNHSDSWSHQPLPYLVRLREIPSGSDDAVPVVHEKHVVAYSLFEALFQANLEAGASGLEDSRFKIEAIGPDLDAYARFLADQYLRALQA